jgi:hypothetical protein
VDLCFRQFEHGGIIQCSIGGVARSQRGTKN